MESRVVFVYAFYFFILLFPPLGDILPEAEII